MGTCHGAQKGRRQGVRVTYTFSKLWGANRAKATAVTLQRGLR